MVTPETSSQAPAPFGPCLGLGSVFCSAKAPTYLTPLPVASPARLRAAVTAALSLRMASETREALS